VRRRRPPHRPTCCPAGRAMSSRAPTPPLQATPCNPPPAQRRSVHPGAAAASPPPSA
jgi:hypothetical protein